MNTRQIISFALIIFSANVFSQVNPFVVDVAPRITNGDTQISFIALIPGAKQSTVESNWLKYTARGSRGKASFTNGIYSQTDVVNPTVSSKPFDVNSNLVNKGEGVQLTVWINQNGSPFRGDGSRNNGDLAVQKYVRDFAIKEYKSATHNQLIAAQHKQRALEKEYAQYQKSYRHSVDSNTYANNAGSHKKGKHHNKKEKLTHSDATKTHNQSNPKMTELEAQRKLVRDTKIRLVEIR